MKIVIPNIIFLTLMCVSSTQIISLYYTPIPITPQLVICLVSGSLSGAKRAALIMTAYVIIGMLGAPVFAGFSGGISHILGPSGGYVIGFIPCSIAAGALSDSFYTYCGSRSMRFAGIFSAFAISAILLYILGALHFMVVTGHGVLQTVALSVLPFIWPDFIKILLSSAFVYKAFDMKNAKYDKIFKINLEKKRKNW